MELKYHIALSLRQDAKAVSHWPRHGVMWVMHHRSWRHILRITQKYSPLWTDVAVGLAFSSCFDHCMDKCAPLHGLKTKWVPRLWCPSGSQQGGLEVATNRKEVPGYTEWQISEADGYASSVMLIKLASILLLWLGCIIFCNVMMLEKDKEHARDC